jgi:hypothetical protein
LVLVTKLTAVLNDSAGATLTMSVGLNGNELWMRWMRYSSSTPAMLNAMTESA